MLFGKQNSELEKFADLLEKGAIALFKERGDLVFSSPPRKSAHAIIEYDGRMRADGMEKFDNEPTYVSAVNFYASEKDLAKRKTLGALIVYVQQEFMAKLMRKLQYPPVDDESEEAMLDSCGTLCNIISGRFKSEISSAGYIELAMSHFLNYRNNAFNGVDFCFAEYNLYSIEFDIDGQKRMVIDITMGAAPKK